MATAHDFFLDGHRILMVLTRDTERSGRFGDCQGRARWSSGYFTFRAMADLASLEWSFGGPSMGRALIRR